MTRELDGDNDDHRRFVDNVRAMMKAAKSVITFSNETPPRNPTSASLCLHLEIAIVSVRKPLADRCPQCECTTDRCQPHIVIVTHIVSIATHYRHQHHHRPHHHELWSSVSDRASYVVIISDPWQSRPPPLSCTPLSRHEPCRPLSRRRSAGSGFNRGDVK